MLRSLHLLIFSVIVMLGILSSVNALSLETGSDFSHAARAGAGLTKNSVIEGFKLSNHAFRKGVLGRGATEEIISGTIRGAREAGTVTTEVATGKFAGNTIEVFVHNGAKVVTDSTRGVIVSIQNLSGFHF